MLAKIALIAANHNHPIARQRANRILRVRYSVTIRSRGAADPAWLPAMSM